MTNGIKMAGRGFIPLDIRPTVSENKLNITYTLYCSSCTYPFDKRHVSIPIDVVEVDGKLFAIETTDYSVGLIDLSSVDVDPETRPLARYTRLATGVYVPIDLLDEATLKDLRGLDEEYSAIREKYKKDCGKSCLDLTTFHDLYLRQFEIIKEQAGIIVGALERKGFKFDINACGSRFNVDIKDPRGRIHSYTTTYLTDYGYLGGFSLLGKTFFEYVKYSSREVHVADCNSVFTLCNDATPIVEDNRVVFECGSELLVPMTPIDPSEVLKGHTYRVERLPLSNIAIAFVPNHHIRSYRDVKKVLVGNEIITFGREIHRCGVCDASISESPIFEPMDAIVYSVNGELFATDSGTPYKLYVDKVENVELLKNFVELPSGLAVDLGEADSDILKRLVELEISLDDEDEVLRRQVDLLIELGITPYKF